MALDVLSLTFAIIAGVANGTFPIFIKTDAVLAAKVHPIVFQLYKSLLLHSFGFAGGCRSYGPGGGLHPLPRGYLVACAPSLRCLSWVLVLQCSSTLLPVPSCHFLSFGWSSISRSRRMKLGELKWQQRRFTSPLWSLVWQCSYSVHDGRNRPSV